ncbi:MAG: 4Fe-4S dicluster domain-containing protein [Bacteroidetes bacterium]|nr:4Fe-4S dicluster domain-containing protein [Bacteroidota bacterium]
MAVGTGIAQSLLTTLKHALWRRVTVQYPEQKAGSWFFEAGVKNRFRGAPLLVMNEETGAARCVGCGICVRACPHGVIHLETHRGPKGERVMDSYEVEIGRCLFCGMCEEACPFAAVKLSHEFELASYQRYNIRYDSSFWKPGAVRPAEPKAIWAAKQ